MGIERCNEIDLIQQTLSGDTSAFDQLVKTHRTTIYVLVLSYIKNPTDAEDLTQRIFIRAYERLSTLRELDCFLHWLQQIAHNICKDWLRRRSELVASLQVVKSSDFSETAPSAEDIVLRAEVEDIVRKAIDGLKETDRKLMEGHYIEGASYDELRAESGLSYAAIANRLKRAKREVRRRVRRLLGGVVMLPGKTVIWGGIETVKLSTKVKLATVAATAVIGIGGGSVLYHHTAQLQPIVANKQTVPEAPITVEGLSSDSWSTTNYGTVGSPLTNETSVNQTSQIDRFEIAESTRDDGVKIVEAWDSSELPKEVAKEIEEHIRTLVENQFDVGDDDAVVKAWTYTFRIQSEEMLENLPEEMRRVFEYLKTNGANPTQEVTIDSGQKLPEDVREAIETLIKKTSEGLPASNRTIEIHTETGKLGEFTQEFAKKITSGEFPVNFAIKRPQSSAHTSSTSTDSQPLSTHSVPHVESTTIPSGPSKETTRLADEEWAEFERLLSVSGEFSDEEWTELERLLDTATGRTTPQQDRQAPLNAERGRSERFLEEPPAAPTERQEIWRQQPDLPETNSGVSPYATTRDWHRTMK